MYSSRGNNDAYMDLQCNSRSKSPGGVAGIKLPLNTMNQGQKIVSFTCQCIGFAICNSNSKLGSFCLNMLHFETLLIPTYTICAHNYTCV